MRVFELEEVGKILNSDDMGDSRMILTAAIAARQAFKNYLVGIDGIGRGNGALKIKQPFEVDMKSLETIFFSNDLTGASDQLINQLKISLEYLKRVPFYFEEIQIIQPENYSVNTGGYFLDAEVGKMTALEDYLEQRRAMEIKEIEPSFEANEQ